MSALRAGSLNAPTVDTVKTSESRPIHLTIGIGQYPHMPAQWLIARRIDTVTLTPPPRHCHDNGFELANGFTVNASFWIGAYR
jgi:hypothetical protein